MRESQIRRLPVLDAESRPVGVVSMNDLVRLASRARKSAIDRELVHTLAAICEPRVQGRGDGAVSRPVVARPRAIAG